MFQLQRYFGALLWHAAFLEGISKLGRLANPHQKLRLRDQLFGANSGLLRHRRQRGEIYMGGQVLFSRRLVRIAACGVLPIRHQRSPMASRQLLGARVAVVDNEQKADADRVSNLPHPLLRSQRDFNALALFRMDSKAI